MVSTWEKMLLWEMAVAAILGGARRAQPWGTLLADYCGACYHNQPVDHPLVNRVCILHIGKTGGASVHDSFCNNDIDYDVVSLLIDNVTSRNFMHGHWNNTFPSI